MNRIPTDEQIAQHFTDMRRACTEKIEARVLRAARRARAGSTEVDGYKSRHGAIGGTGGGMKVEDEETGKEIIIDATIVETMALNDCRPDPIHHQFDLLFDMHNQAALSSRAVVNTIERIDKEQTADKAPGHSTTPCKSEVNGCDGTANKRGWCDPCRLWIWDNPSSDGLDPLTVPASVIEERTKTREKAS